MRCLVVDPSHTIRRGVLRALQGFAQVEVVTRDDLGSALDGVEPPLDLAIVGWAEDDRALDLVRTLRAQPELDRIPIVIVSARTSHEDVRAARNAGATDYVLRPFTPESLAERLGRHVDPAPEQRAA